MLEASMETLIFAIYYVLKTAVINTLRELRHFDRGHRGLPAHPALRPARGHRDLAGFGRLYEYGGQHPRSVPDQYFFLSSHHAFPGLLACFSQRAPHTYTPRGLQS